MCTSVGPLPPGVGSRPGPEEPGAGARPGGEYLDWDLDRDRGGFGGTGAAPWSGLLNMFTRAYLGGGCPVNKSADPDVVGLGPGG